MALKMKLAIQVPGERITLDVQQDTTVASLRDLIAGKAQIPSSRQKIMAGYPPRALSPSRNGETLESVGVRDGDMLRVCKTAARTFSRKIIPADNACLFNSVAFCLEGGRSDMAPELRALIAGVVLSDPEGYCEAVLGKPPREYCEWIQDKAAWGGGIECRILAEHYGVEIDCVDCQTMIVYRFGEDQAYLRRIFLMYDGIHYDVLAEGPDAEKAVFDRADSEAQEMAVGVVQVFHDKHDFTDVAKFAIKCLVCGEGLAGAAAVQDHAAKTGHSNFAENKPSAA